MKFLNSLWPWKELNRLNEEVDFLKRTLEHEQTSHNLTRASLQDHKLELIDHKSRNTQSQKDIRKLATILAMRGGITLILIFFSLSALGQPLQRQLFTTNPPPLLSAVAGPFVTTNGAGFPVLTYDGSVLTNIAGVAVAVNTNAVAVTNGQLVTISGVTDTNAVRGLITAVTNGAINNLSNLVATIGANGTNFSLLIGSNATNNDANSTNFALLVGANGTNNDNLHAANNTNFTLLIGANATNNDANSTNFALLIGSNATNNDANSTNFALLIGSNGTNNSTAITNGAINNLSNLVATIGANDTNNASTKQTDWLNPNNFIFIEEFTGHSSGDLTTGQNGWRVLGVGSGSASVTLNASAAQGHCGMVTLTPGGTVSGGMLVMLNGTTNSVSDLLLPVNALNGNAFSAWTNRWIFRTGSATNDMKCWIGLVNNIVYGNAKPADFVGVELDTTNNVNIQYICGASSTYSTATGPLIQPSTWYNFVMYSTVANTINFYINNANSQSINANVSALGLNLLADVWKTATTASATITLDYCSFIGTGTAR